MIQISKGKLAVEGSNLEIIDDLRDLVMAMCMRNSHTEIVEVAEIGIKSSIIDYLFTLESLLRMIYTCYSTSEEAFNELLRTNKKIVEEIKRGDFKLIFKDGKE